MKHIIPIIVLVSALAIAVAEIRPVEAGIGGKEHPVLRNGFKLCPPERKISFECLAPPSVDAHGVTMEMNNVHKVERNRRYFLGGNMGENIFPVDVPFGNIVLKCYGNQGSSFSIEVSGTIECPNESTHVSTTASDDVCVAVKGTDYIGTLEMGWVLTGGTGVTYKPDDHSTGIVPPHHSVLTYQFQVPIAHNYAIVVDMGTKHPTEHNDIWLKCTGGFTLWKHDSMKTADGFVKVYHNGNGRRKEGVTIDFQGYSLSTKQIYYPDNTYTCYVGARSTMTTLYGILAFPCNGNDCQRGSQLWSTRLSKCNV